VTTKETKNQGAARRMRAYRARRHGWTPAPEGWLNTTEVAARLGVSRQRVHELLRERRLDAVLHRGRFWRYDPGSIARFEQVRDKWRVTHPQEADPA
jgi:excisionase family DNA binding protein